MAGVMQPVAKARQWLSRLAGALRRGKQRRDRARIERDIENYLKGRQHLGQVIRFKLTGKDPHVALTYEFDQAAFDTLARDPFGRAERVTYQLEEIEPDIAPLLPNLGVPG